MNEYDSNRIYDVAKKINYKRTTNLSETDCYVLNTCHIREKATEKVFHDVGRVKKEFKNKKKPILIISGCVAQAEGDILIQKEKYIDSGKAKLIFRHFPLNSLDLAASMISRCTTEERYYPLLGLYFKRQSTWMNATDPSAEVMKLARLAGIGKDTFDQCLANKDLQTYLLQVRQDGQKKYNVEATPTLIINGETHKGNMSFEALDEILSKLE